MSENKRQKTRYPGVTYRNQKKRGGTGHEKMYYIRYRRGGRGSREIEEPVGRQGDGMTAARANKIRALRASGAEPSNTEARMAASEKSACHDHTVHDLWLAYRDAHLQASSIRSECSVSKLLGPVWNMEVSSLTSLDIEKLTQTLFHTPARRKKNSADLLSAQSVKHALSLLHRILKYGERIGLCPFPSGLVFKMPRLDNQKTETMTAGQLRSYLAALDAEPDQDAATFLRVALFTGMRKSAIINLEWVDLDFEKNMMTLQGIHAKNRRTEIIPMPLVLKQALLKLRRTESPYVFPGKNGGKRADFRRIARRVRDKAGLPPDFRPIHGLRHTFASFLASNGVGLYVLQKLMTHESPGMTKRYAHLSDEAMQKAANVVNGMVADQGPCKTNSCS